MLSAPLSLLAKASLPSSAMPTDADFQALMRRVLGELSQITADLVQSSIGVIDWAGRFETLLLQGHTDASVLGRSLAFGEMVEPSLVDLAAAREVVDFEHDFIAQFMDALLNRDERYWADGVLIADAVDARQAMYTGRMRGTATGAFMNTSPKDALFKWVMGGVEDHCEDCPGWAEMGFMPAEDWPTWPGANDTPCLFNCKCHMVRQDGVMSFRA